MQHTAHDLDETVLSPAAVRVLGEVRRANLNGRLYLDPRRGSWRDEALDELACAGLVEATLIAPAFSERVGGWYASRVQ